MENVFSSFYKVLAHCLCVSTEVLIKCHQRCKILRLDSLPKTNARPAFSVCCTELKTPLVVALNLACRGI